MAHVLMLYFLPGILFFLSLHWLRQPLSQGLRISPWLTQMVLAEFVLFGSMVVIVVNSGATLDSVGLTRIQWWSPALAIVYGEIAARLLSFYGQKVGVRLIDRLDDIPFLRIPDWHYQKISPPSYPRWADLTLMILIQSSNVVVEEIYFRGFLFEKTAYRGLWNWLFNGTLFILYHFFQASKTYGLFPLGFFIAGYYALTRDVYGCMIVHYFLNSRLRLKSAAS